MTLRGLATSSLFQVNCRACSSVHSGRTVERKGVERAGEAGLGLGLSVFRLNEHRVVPS